MTARAEVLAAVAVTALAIAPVVPPVTAQDCSIGRSGSDDIQRFRVCIEEHGLEAWSPWMLHSAAHRTTGPTVVRLQLQAGADPNAPNDDGLSPLQQGARNSNPDGGHNLLDAGGDLNARDNEGYTAHHCAAAQRRNSRVVKVLLDGGRSYCR